MRRNAERVDNERVERFETYADAGDVSVFCNYPGCTSTTVAESIEAADAERAQREHVHIFGPPRWLVSS